MAKLTFKELTDLGLLVAQELGRRQLASKNAPNPNQFDLFPAIKPKTTK